MKKVLLTSNLYLPNVGGIENSLYYLAKAGAENNDDVTIISSNIVAGAESLNEEDEYKEGFLVKRYRVAKFSSKIKTVISHITSALNCYSTKNGSYDVVVARYHLTVIFLYLAGHRNIKYLVPGVVKYRNSYRNALRQGLGIFLRYTYNRFLQAIALRLCDDIYVFSKLMNDQVKDVYSNAEPKSVLPGVDLERYSYSTKKDSNASHMLIVGRLVKDKGIDQAILSLKFLPEEFRLTVVGDGPEFKALTQQVAELNLENRVTFEGRTSNPELYYQQADIFLMTSCYEPFGQTILEATASGLPVVAFSEDSVLTNTSRILGGHGFYAREYEPKALAEQIKKASQKLKNDESFGDTLNLYARDNFSWANLYRDLSYD